MTSRARKHLTAWLGLAAMWLVVLAPLVSQLVVAAHRDVTTESVLCSAIQPSAGSALQDHADRIAACGYCDLLADHTAMPPVHPALPALFVVLSAAVPALVSRHVPFSAFASPRPRAPPVALLPRL
jgi:hypothetical protein